MRGPAVGSAPARRSVAQPPRDRSPRSPKARQRASPNKATASAASSGCAERARADPAPPRHSPAPPAPIPRVRRQAALGLGILALGLVSRGSRRPIRAAIQAAQHAESASACPCRWLALPYRSRCHLWRVALGDLGQAVESSGMTRRVSRGRQGCAERPGCDQCEQHGQHGCHDCAEQHKPLDLLDGFQRRAC